MMANFEVSVSAPPAAVWRLTRWLLAAAALVLVMHIIAILTRDSLPLRPLFDLDRENTLPSWFSSGLLLAGAVLMLGIGERARRRGERLARRWILLGAVFVLLSLDESASFHEVTIEPIRNHLGLDGIFYFAWIVPALIFLVFMAIIYVPFLFALPSRLRRGMVLAAVLYLGGAVGMEMVGGLVASEEGGILSTRYVVVYTIEEMLEILGLTALLHALMLHAFASNHPPRPSLREPV